MGFGDFIKKVQDKCDEVANSIKASDAIVQINKEMESGAADIDKAWINGIDSYDKQASKINSNGGLLSLGNENSTASATEE